MGVYIRYIRWAIARGGSLHEVGSYMRWVLYIRYTRWAIA